MNNIYRSSQIALISVSENKVTSFKNWNHIYTILHQQINSITVKTQRYQMRNTKVETILFARRSVANVTLLGAQNDVYDFPRNAEL